VALLGAPGIDLNFGCPAKTVNRHDGGATLLKKPSRLYDIISAVKRAVGDSIPVSAKVRLGFEDKTLCTEIARAVEEAHAEKIVIHARTRKEGYKPPAHWEFIAEMKQHLSIPCVANGDIWTLDDYLRCRKISTCDDVSLGRAAFARPDLALQIRHHLQQQSFETTPWEEVRYNWLRHFFLRSEHFRTEKYAVARMKQWVKFLARTYPEAEALFDQIKRLQTSREMSPYFVNSQREGSLTACEKSSLAALKAPASTSSFVQSTL
jgi:tRNA-dihydrouridine synthase C